MTLRPEQQFDCVFKILLIGDSSVGKSAATLRYVEHRFERTTSSVGLDFKFKIFELEGRRVKVQVWDTAGQERFRSITSLSFRGSHGVMLFYDITNHKSFENVSYWMNTIRTSSLPDNVKVILIGNKCDLENRRVVDSKSGEDLARELNVPFFETSTKANINIEEAFHTLVRLIMADEEHLVREDVIIPDNSAPVSHHCCIKSLF